MAVRSYGPHTDLGYVCTVTSTLSPWITIMWNIKLFRSNLWVSSYGSDMDFGYLFTVTLALEIQHKDKVTTHPWVIENKCMNYDLDLTGLNYVNFFKTVNL